MPGNLFGCRAFSFLGKQVTNFSQLSERFGAPPKGATHVIRGLSMVGMPRASANNVSKIHEGDMAMSHARHSARPTRALAYALTAALGLVLAGCAAKAPPPPP
ncbi:hypothetical protein, partial [Novosphingobium capsulatum]|uniref:hypothetical protein n=1 Tax=Novosphingobium capsulatum TaxID=13688 RepID=UPI001C3FCB56